VKGYNSIFSTDSAEESEKERTRKTKLGKFARKRFEAMLRSLSGLRGELARCMAFSLEHAEASNEVSIVSMAMFRFRPFLTRGRLPGRRYHRCLSRRR
jgi:U2-associated protein SR140